MSDKEIIDALIARDEKVTQQFFFRNCRPLFVSIIRYVFSYSVDYDEFVNEFYIYLMENDARRLRQFEERSTIYQWLKTVAIRYFIAKRDRMIDVTPKNTLKDDDKPALRTVTEQSSVNDSERHLVAQMDVERLLALMPNRRYVYVIRRLVLDEAEPLTVAEELGTNVDNLYNIKKRAVASLTDQALKEVERYEKEISK